MTKGEWEAMGNFVAVQKEDGNSYEICKVSSFQSKAKENAYLIAAAPEMYWALKELLDAIDTDKEIIGYERKQSIRSAIKKAEECGQ